MFATMVVMTSIDAMVTSQSVYHSFVGGSRVSTTYGVLFSVDRYPAIDMKT